MKNLFVIVMTFSLFWGADMLAQQKNVVFVIVDDLGWKDLSCAGSEYYETPNIDSLAANGVSFSNAYTAHPRCVPSRFAMMTGKFPARVGNPGRGGEMDVNEFTVAEALKDHGYTTFFTGKWHLGHDEAHWPHHQGFDINKGGCYAGAPRSYFFPYHIREGDEPGDYEPMYGLEEGEDEEFLTDRLTDETVKFIQEHKDEPFFACVAHYAVHTPIEAKNDMTKKYRAKLKKMELRGAEYAYGIDGRQKLLQNDPVYAAMIQSVDESVGRIIAALKEEGIFENTIIILTSDHGGLSNSGTDNKRRLATSNLPLRAGKGHSYEGGIKVPTIVYWKGKADDGSVRSSVITGTDYYPTILNMLDLPLLPDQHVDGVSFVAAIEGEEINQQREFYWHSPTGRPTSTGDYNCSVIRINDYKLLDFYDTDRLELYNLKDDPNEEHNLAKEESVLAGHLQDKLNAWKTDIDAYIKTKKKKK